MKIFNLNSYSKYVMICIAFAAITTIFVSFNAFYENPDRSIYSAIEGNIDWLKVHDDVRISVEDVISTYKLQLGLSDDDKLVPIRTERDQHSISHARFQHFHKNVKVEGSQLLVHSRKGFVQLVNGSLIRNLDATIQINVTKQEAINMAKNLSPAELYMWESDYAEKLIKTIKKNPRATNYPDGSLVLVNSSFSRTSTDYRLAYDVTIHSMVPERKRQFFIDAATGEIIVEINDLHTGSSHGTAQTKYHGLKPIITDSIAVDSFRLVDTIRGNGIFTRNALRTTNLENSVDFYDDDNYWNNFNAFRDEVAGDVHYGASTTFDFYGTLGQIGLNDTMPFLSFVHVGNNWTNATWNGMFARFGDAQSPDKPLTSLDVVGHEFTHGLTDFTADLVYMDEPGGLNESFSDVFGTAIEFYGDIESADWLVGEDFIASGGFRSMSDPKSFGHPDTYFGEYWESGEFDNGGVHINSGVQNYWFYLLSEGGSGINDNGESYNIEGISIDSSIRIAYGNLKNYLVETSQYSDARLGSIQAAIDYFGECSNEVAQTTNAWHAVGVGNVYPRADIALLDIVGPELITCGVSDQELVTVLMQFNDCGDSLQVGTVVPFSYAINQGDTIYEDLILSETIFDGDSLEFTFNTPIANFISPGTYIIKVMSDYEQDNSAHNNSVRKEYERIYAQNSDIALQDITFPRSGCFLAVEPVMLTFSFEGCDSIVAGELVELQYRIGTEAWVVEGYSLEETLYRGDEVLVQMQGSYDFSSKGEYDMDARIIYEADTLLLNNVQENHIVDNPDPLQFRVMMTFEGDTQSAMDSFFVNSGVETTQQILDGVGFKESRGLRITGNNGIQEMVDGNLPKLTMDSLFTEDYNPYVTSTCFCVDLTSTLAANLRFRLNQKFSPIYEDIYGSPMNFASSLRLMCNGEQVGNTYTGSNPSDNPYFNLNINVGDYVGGPLEICFEATTLTSPENDPYGIGDEIHLDNIILLADMIVGTKVETFDKTIRIYPNPASDIVYVQIDEVDMTAVQVELFDIKGQQVVTYVKTKDKSGIQLDVSSLPSGIFLLRVIQDGQASVVKMIKN